MPWRGLRGHLIALDEMKCPGLWEMTCETYHVVLVRWFAALRLVRETMGVSTGCERLRNQGKEVVKRREKKVL